MVYSSRGFLKTTIVNVERRSAEWRVAPDFESRSFDLLTPSRVRRAMGPQACRFSGWHR